MGIIFPTDHASGIMPVSKTRLNHLTYTSCIYGISNEYFICSYKIRSNPLDLLVFKTFTACLISSNDIHSVYSIFEKNSRIRNKQMFTNALAFSRVSYFLYFFCFSHMFCGKKVVVVFL